MTRRKKLIVYVAIAFGWSWLLWLPYAAVQQGLDVSEGVSKFLTSIHSFGAWGPLVAALVIAAWGGGRSGLVDMLKRGLRFRFGVGWWLIALLLYPVMMGVSLMAGVRLGDTMPDMPMLAQPLTLPIVFVVVLLNYGPLQEEFGWRGVVQDNLQQGWNALAASLIAGLMWGVWHLPLFFMNRPDLYYQEPIWGLILSTVLASVLFAWVYNNTGRSVLAAMLIHASFNLGHVALPTLGMERAPAILIALQLAAIVVVLVLWGPRTLAEPRWKRGSEVGA